MDLYRGDETINKREIVDDQILEEFIDLENLKDQSIQEAGYTTLTPVSSVLSLYVRKSKSIDEKFRDVSNKMETLYTKSHTYPIS